MASSLKISPAGGQGINLKVIVMQEILKILNKGINLIENPKEKSNNTLLPRILSQELFHFFMQNRFQVSRIATFDQIIHNTFKNSSMCPLNEIRISELHGITTKTLTKLLKANPNITHLEIFRCRIRYDNELWLRINSSTCLHTLKLDYLFGPLTCPNLKCLTVLNRKYTQTPNTGDDWISHNECYDDSHEKPRILAKFLKHVISNLTYLELFYVKHPSYHLFSSITTDQDKNICFKLKTLLLHTNKLTQNLLDSILKFKELRKLHIYISCNYDESEKMLLKVQKAELPFLKDLRIKGSKRIGGTAFNPFCFIHTLEQYIDSNTGEYLSKETCSKYCRPLGPGLLLINV